MAYRNNVSKIPSSCSTGNCGSIKSTNSSQFYNNSYNIPNYATNASLLNNYNLSTSRYSNNLRSTSNTLTPICDDLCDPLVSTTPVIQPTTIYMNSNSNTSNTIALPNLLQVPHLSRIPTDTVRGAVWTDANCSSTCNAEVNYYIGNYLSTESHPGIALVYRGINGPNDTYVFGYNISNFFGNNKSIQNSVYAIDYQGYISRTRPSGSNVPYKYYFNFVPFSQSDSTLRSSYLFVTKTIQNASSVLFKFRAGAKYRLSMISENINGEILQKLADSNILSSVGTSIDGTSSTTPIQIQILSNSTINGYLGISAENLVQLTYNCAANIFTEQNVGCNNIPYISITQVANGPGSVKCGNLIFELDNSSSKSGIIEGVPVTLTFNYVVNDGTQDSPAFASPYTIFLNGQYIQPDDQNYPNLQTFLVGLINSSLSIIDQTGNNSLLSAQVGVSITDGLLGWKSSLIPSGTRNKPSKVLFQLTLAYSTMYL